MYLARRFALLVPVSLAAVTVACSDGNATLSPTGPTAGSVSSISAQDTDGSETASTLARGHKRNEDKEDDDKGNKGGGGGNTGEKPDHGKPDSDEERKIDKPFRGSLSGFVTAVDGTSITVRGITVTPAPDAVIRHGNRILDFATIVIGNHVQAKGTMTEGALLAREIKVERTHGEDEEEEEEELAGATDDETEVEAD